MGVDYHEAWENDRTPTPVRVFDVRLRSMRLSVGKVISVLELLGVDPISRRGLEPHARIVEDRKRRHDGVVIRQSY